MRPCHWLTDWVTFWFWHYSLALETCDLWDIWSEWWGDLTWPKKRPTYYLPTYLPAYLPTHLPCNTDYNTDNWEPGLMTIFVTWQLIVTAFAILAMFVLFFLQISLFLSQDKQPSWKIRYTCHNDILYFSLKQTGEAIVIQIPVFHKTKRTKFGFLFPNLDRVGAGYSNVSKSWSNLKRWVKEFRDHIPPDL